MASAAADSATGPSTAPPATPGTPAAFVNLHKHHKPYNLFSWYIILYNPGLPENRGVGEGGRGSIELRDRGRITFDPAAGCRLGEWGSRRRHAGRRSVSNPSACMPPGYNSTLTGCKTLDRSGRRWRQPGGWRQRAFCCRRLRAFDCAPGSCCWATGPKASSGRQRSGRTVSRRPVCFGFNMAEAPSWF